MSAKNDAYRSLDLALMKKILNPTRCTVGRSQMAVDSKQK